MEAPTENARLLEKQHSWLRDQQKLKAHGKQSYSLSFKCEIVYIEKDHSVTINLNTTRHCKI